MPTRVLLADDHALIRQGLKALLEKQGIQVVTEASDGQEAVRLAEKAQPEVAILDITMPGEKNDFCFRRRPRAD